MRGVARGTCLAFVTWALIAIEFGTSRPSAAKDSSRQDTTATCTSTLSISVDGGAVTLIDPRGRANQGGASPKAQIPNCSRVEGPTKGAHSLEEAGAPRVELDLLSPTQGTYRISVHAERPLVFVQVMGECGTLRCGSADHLTTVAGRLYEWRISWGACADSGKCLMKLQRTRATKSGQRTNAHSTGS
jgi:hypothetical protein